MKFLLHGIILDTMGYNEFKKLIESMLPKIWNVFQKCKRNNEIGCIIILKKMFILIQQLFRRQKQNNNPRQ
jgi:hypothetical protein